MFSRKKKDRTYSLTAYTGVESTPAGRKNASPAALAAAASVGGDRTSSMSSQLSSAAAATALMRHNSLTTDSYRNSQQGRSSSMTSNSSIKSSASVQRALARANSVQSSVRSSPASRRFSASPSVPQITTTFERTNQGRTMSLTTTTVRRFGSFELVKTNTTTGQVRPNKRHSRPGYAASALSFESDLNPVYEDESSPATQRSGLGSTLPKIGFSDLAEEEEEEFKDFHQSDAKPKKHVPPPRSVSPMRSALKDSAASSVSSSADDNFLQAQNTNSSFQSSSSLAKAKKASRVSFVGADSDDDLEDYKPRQLTPNQAAARQAAVKNTSKKNLAHSTNLIETRRTKMNATAAAASAVRSPSLNSGMGPPPRSTSLRQPAAFARFDESDSGGSVYSDATDIYDGPTANIDSVMLSRSRSEKKKKAAQSSGGSALRAGSLRNSTTPKKATKGSEPKQQTKPQPAVSTVVAKQTVKTVVTTKPEGAKEDTINSNSESKEEVTSDLPEKEAAPASSAHYYRALADSDEEQTTGTEGNDNNLLSAPEFETPTSEYEPINSSYLAPAGLQSSVEGEHDTGLSTTSVTDTGESITAPSTEPSSEAEKDKPINSGQEALYKTLDPGSPEQIKPTVSRTSTADDAIQRESHSQSAKQKPVAKQTKAKSSALAAAAASSSRTSADYDADIDDAISLNSDSSWKRERGSRQQKKEFRLSMRNNETEQLNPSAPSASASMRFKASVSAQPHMPGKQAIPQARAGRSANNSSFKRFSLREPSDSQKRIEPDSNRFSQYNPSTQSSFGNFHSRFADSDSDSGDERIFQGAPAVSSSSQQPSSKVRGIRSLRSITSKSSLRNASDPIKSRRSYTMTDTTAPVEPVAPASQAPQPSDNGALPAIQENPKKSSGGGGKLGKIFSPNNQAKILVPRNGGSSSAPSSPARASKAADAPAPGPAAAASESVDSPQKKKKFSGLRKVFRLD